MKYIPNNVPGFQMFKSFFIDDYINNNWFLITPNKMFQTLPHYTRSKRCYVTQPFLNSNNFIWRKDCCFHDHDKDEEEGYWRRSTHNAFTAKVL